ncbi:MAG: hydrogenase maturation protease [Deltaproteobacteria bacterium]|nr:hydrogenase maturation protease [Deltaproteobacteria bacterium]
MDKAEAMRKTVPEVPLACTSQPSLPRALIVGYGNIDRADDGIAFEVINTLRRHQSRAPLGDEDTGLEALGTEIDTVFLSQLTPELLETLRDYDHIIFVDAHVYPDIGTLHCRDILPEGAPSILIHHLTPEILLAFLKALYGRDPLGHLVSLRGYDFDFHRHLSAKAKRWSKQAVQYIEQWLSAHGHGEWR